MHSNERLLINVIKAQEQKIDEIRIILDTIALSLETIDRLVAAYEGFKGALVDIQLAHPAAKMSEMHELLLDQLNAQFEYPLMRAKRLGVETEV